MTRTEITSALALFGLGCFALLVPVLVLGSETSGWALFLIGSACLAAATHRLKSDPA